MCCSSNNSSYIFSNDFPAAIDTTKCSPVKTLATSWSTGITNHGLTAINTISLNYTSSFPLSKTEQPIWRNKSRRVELISVAAILSGLQIPLDKKPLARASAIYPAPINPIRLVMAAALPSFVSLAVFYIVKLKMIILSWVLLNTIYILQF